MQPSYPFARCASPSSYRGPVAMRTRPELRCFRETCARTQSSRFCTGPDGPHTLCIACYRQYYSKKLIIYEHLRTGTFSVRHTSASRPVRVVGFHLKSRVATRVGSSKRRPSRDLTRPIVVPVDTSLALDDLDLQSVSSLDQSEDRPDPVLEPTNDLPPCDVVGPSPAAPSQRPVGHTRNLKNAENPLVADKHTSFTDAHDSDESKRLCDAPNSPNPPSLSDESEQPLDGHDSSEDFDQEDRRCLLAGSADHDSDQSDAFDAVADTELPARSLELPIDSEPIHPFSTLRSDVHSAKPTAHAHPMHPPCTPEPPPQIIRRSPDIACPGVSNWTQLVGNSASPFAHKELRSRQQPAGHTDVEVGNTENEDDGSTDGGPVATVQNSGREESAVQFADSIGMPNADLDRNISPQVVEQVPIPVGQSDASARLPSALVFAPGGGVVTNGQERKAENAAAMIPITTEAMRGGRVTPAAIASSGPITRNEVLDVSTPQLESGSDHFANAESLPSSPEVVEVPVTQDRLSHRTAGNSTDDEEFTFLAAGVVQAMDGTISSLAYSEVPSVSLADETGANGLKGETGIFPRDECADRTACIEEVASMSDVNSTSNNLHMRGFEVSVKAGFRGRYLRLRLSSEACFNFVKTELARVFELKGDFGISYEDDEGDKVILSSDYDMPEMFSLVKEYSISPLRMGIELLPLEQDERECIVIDD